jgi:hypothetical protein
VQAVDLSPHGGMKGANREQVKAARNPLKRPGAYAARRPAGAGPGLTGWLTNQPRTARADCQSLKRHDCRKDGPGLDGGLGGCRDLDLLLGKSKPGYPRRPHCLTRLSTRLTGLPRSAACLVEAGDPFRESEAARTRVTAVASCMKLTASYKTR